MLALLILTCNSMPSFTAAFSEVFSLRLLYPWLQPRLLCEKIEAGSHVVFLFISSCDHVMISSMLTAYHLASDRSLQD